MSDRELRTILLVDKSASILFYLAMLLKRLEYKVVTAQSAEDALRIMEQTVPSIILTDIALPHMDGITFLGYLKGSQRFRAVPVVILTARNDPAVKVTCMGKGCAAFLAKPVEPDILYRTLQTVSESIPRANIRIDTSLKIILEDEGTMESEVATTISEGGLFVRTDRPRQKDARISITLFLGERKVRAKAVVLYASRQQRDTGEGPGMGMKFVEIAEPDRMLIKAFIKERLTKDLSAA